MRVGRRLLYHNLATDTRHKNVWGLTLDVRGRREHQVLRVYVYYQSQLLTQINIKFVSLLWTSRKRSVISKERRSGKTVETQTHPLVSG